MTQPLLAVCLRGTSGSTGQLSWTLWTGVSATTCAYTPMMKEIDFWKKALPHSPVNIEIVDIFKYLDVHINNKLDWSNNTDAVYKKGLSRLHPLRILRSFGL